MTKLNHSVYKDPTLEAMDRAIILERQLEKPRNYLGASEIGTECSRYLFYSFRNACKKEFSIEKDPDGYQREIDRLKTVEDGHYQEELTKKRLRSLPYVELYDNDGTVDEKGCPNQIGFQSLLGHFCGHCDGIVKGLLQSPKTWHVFEHKCRYEKFINQLIKIRSEKGEKLTLLDWSIEYYAQAQIYMHEFQLTRHWLVVCSPGGRMHESIRTEYKPTYAEMLIEKAKNIIFDNFSIPAKINNKREFYQCNWCKFKGICHDGDIPDVHCKSCRYRDCIDGGKSTCLATDTIIEDTLLNVGCPKHVFNPALLPNVKLLEHQSDGCLYQVLGKDYVFANTNLTGFPDVGGKIDGIFTSKQLREDIVNINNIDDKIVREFKGTVIDSDQGKKAWEKGNKWNLL